jgi:hypothetical protein
MVSSRRQVNYEARRGQAGYCEILTRLQTGVSGKWRTHCKNSTGQPNPSQDIALILKTSKVNQGRAAANAAALIVLPLSRHSRPSCTGPTESTKSPPLSVVGRQAANSGLCPCRNTWREAVIRNLR